MTLAMTLVIKTLATCTNTMIPSTSTKLAMRVDDCGPELPPVEIRTGSCDVTRADDVQAALKKATDAFGPFDFRSTTPGVEPKKRGPHHGSGGGGVGPNQLAPESSLGSMTIRRIPSSL